MNTNEIIKNRSEILFLYDVSFANPNGDPLESNKPRLDDLTGKCLVTDVRLKRTIRDYLFNHGYDGTNGQDIFIREEDGKVVSGKIRSKAYENKDDFIQKFIDGRLFGGVSAPGKESSTKDPKVFHLTGPVQFSFGQSLHKVEVNFIYGNAAFASDDEKDQKSFREEYNISYGLIGFHGVVNENAAKETHLTEFDVLKMLEGMWYGTRDLLTRSKKTHMPRMLVKIDYKDGFFIGDLLKEIKLILKPNISDEKMIRSTEDYILDLNGLYKKLIKYKDKIISVYYITDDNLHFEPSFDVFLKSLEDAGISSSPVMFA